MEFIRSHVRDRGYPPTVREIGSEFGFSAPGAKNHLKALARKGYIKVAPGMSRGIEVLDMHFPEALSLPLVGDIRAGRPILAVEEISERISVDRDLFSDEGAFVLRVKGDSMMDAGIFHSDFIIVSPRSQVERGEIGVALIGGDEATVKRIYHDGPTVRLVPENSAMSPTEYPASDVSVLGRVVGVMRKIH